MEDLLGAVLARELATTDLQLCDGRGCGPEERLFPSSASCASREGAFEKSFDVCGRVWTVSAHARPAFFTAVGRRGHWEILAAGAILSLMLGCVLALVQGAEARAMALAELRGEALRATESQYREVFEKAPLGMATVDTLTGRYLAVNPRLGQILGYGQEELLALTYHDLTHPDHRVPGLQAMERLNTGEVDEFVFEKRYLRKDGQEVWAVLRVSRLPVLPGESPRHLAMITDITDRKRAEAALLESEARFRSVVENAGDAIAIHDLAGRFHFCNPEVARSTGYTLEELRTLSVRDLVPDLEAGLPSGTWENLAFGQQHSYLGLSRRKDGTTFPIDARIGVLRADGPRMILVVVRDLSERLQARESELRARKAESLVLMAGSIAHDFNNLFQAIQSNLEIAALHVRAQEAPSQSIAQAKGALQQAVSLSWKILDFSGRGFLRLEPLVLGPWLTALAEALRGEQREGFLLELECLAMPTILADRAKLEQVVRALVSNAVEAALPGTAHIRLRLESSVRRSASTGVWPLDPPLGPSAILVLSDAGPGVPQAQLGLVCDPFFTTRERGRGLGLAAAVGILRAHHAGLWLGPGEDGGLSAELYFPLEEPD
jgi:PAS domain S-box-containing protein